MRPVFYVPPHYVDRWDALRDVVLEIASPEARWMCSASSLSLRNDYVVATYADEDLQDVVDLFKFTWEYGEEKGEIKFTVEKEYEDPQREYDEWARKFVSGGRVVFLEESSYRKPGVV